MMRHYFTAVALAVASMSGIAVADTVQWDGFAIRNSNSNPNPALTNVAPTFTENGDGAGITADVELAGQKVGYGTDYLNGKSISTLGTLTYSRFDTNGGEIYTNVWVSDGTHYALLTPRSVNGDAYTSSTVNGIDLQTSGFGIYGESDYSNLNWLYSGAHRTGSGNVLKADNTTLTIGDLAATLKILSPTFPGYVGAGTGDPQAGHGFQIIFGDTAANHTGNGPYIIDNVSLSVHDSPAAAPLPATWTGGLVLVGLVLFKRKGRPQVA